MRGVRTVSTHVKDAPFCPRCEFQKLRCVLCMGMKLLLFQCNPIPEIKAKVWVRLTLGCDLNMSEYGICRYMKGMDQIRRMERREQKFKIRLEVLGRANSERTVSRVKLSQSRSLPKRGRHQLGRGSPDSRTQMDPEWSQGPRVQEDAEWAKIPLVPPEGLVFDPETQGRDVTAESRSHEWGGGETVRVPGLQIQFQEDWTQGSETQSEQHQWNQFEMMELSASRDSLPGSGNACHVPLHVAETNMASGDLGSLRPALNDASPVDAFSVNLEGAPLLSPGGVSPGGTLVRMDTLPEVDEDVISV